MRPEFSTFAETSPNAVGNGVLNLEGEYSRRVHRDDGTMN
jgi:hypothetical protein